MPAELLAWYICLCMASAANIGFYVQTIRRPLAIGKARRRYQRILRALALPVVVQCAWRSIFPSLYLQRFTFWDTPTNSILVDRTLACAGELAWNAALATVLTHVDAELAPPSGTWWARLSAAALFGLYVLAEAVSYYNTATTNELWAAIEVAIDAISQVVAAPAALLLLHRVVRRTRTARAALLLSASTEEAPTPARGVHVSSAAASSAQIFLSLFLVAATLYPVYNFAVDVPLYMGRYRADQQAGKHYLPLWAGLVDAATRRVPTHKLDDWRGDMQWMLLYFVLNPAAATLVARTAPSVATPCCV